MYRVRDRESNISATEKPVDVAALECAATALLGVLGMGCPNCATRVRNGLLSDPGVLTVQIELLYQLARVAYDPKRTTERALLDAVSAAGDQRHTYQAVLL